ncbi:T9SS type A sorting domain-containing protein [Flavobacterium sp. B17]|uniref:T9SS type A sorting domain-containing protein n=1 Tax=Flavobacterium sp. B17 TaxID=95618 RepID=UPI0005B280D3|nr:T9SS type A sorting domain-containing protein [Flavobacterium sp. B17]
MKKIFLLMLMAFLTSMNFLNAQTSTDFIICIDNSGSISSQRYNEISVSAKKLIENILACHPKNRVAVTHYGTGLYGQSNSSYNPRIYIESDFTNNIVTAQSFIRRLDVGDHFHEALGLIGMALDNNYSPDIVSPQTTLNKNPDSNLVIILFTDAQRSGGDLISGSYLVNYYDPTLASPAAFKNVSVFKKERRAKFAVVHISPDSYSTQAGASIASAGGSYTGAVESNTDDIDFGILPRLYFGKSDFILNANEILEITQNVCDNSGGGSLEMFYEPNNCGGLNSVQSVFGSYNLPPGANFVSFDLSIVSLTTGDQYPVSYNPTYTSPTEFWQWMVPADFSSVPGSAMVGQFKFLLMLTYEVGGTIYHTSSWNNYPFFSYDIDFISCNKSAPQKAPQEKKEYKVDRNADPNHFKKNIVAESAQQFQITPNPTNGIFKVILNKDLENGAMQIVDLTGNVIYNKVFRNSKELNVDISSQKQGVYLIKIISDNNKIMTEKIIKK